MRMLKRIRRQLLVAGAALAVGVCQAPSGDLKAQGAVALRGVVSSQEEGKMEGVVVSARRVGGTFTVSVVSDDKGRYSFPRSHLMAGPHALTIRAVGYDLTDPGTVEVTASQTANRDLTLQKTRDLASQLSSLEWTMSMPGTEEQKSKLVNQLLSCAYCHTYERIMKSKYTAEQFVPVITRMATYFVDGTALSRDNRGRALRAEHPEGAEKSPTWGFSPPVPKTELGQYLATVNLSGGKTTWPYELKTLPRPTGKATRVIMTQYDLPRKDTVPHDVDVDATGTPWYGDQGQMFIGRLDPKTGVVTEFPLPPLPPKRVGGISDVHSDNEGNLWFPITTATGTSHFGAPARFEPKTQKLTVLEGPDNVQFLTKGPDGKIWMNNTATIIRIDPKAMKIDATFTVNAKTPGAPPGPHSLYQVGVNSKGDAFGFDWMGSYIVGIDAATSAMKFFPTPTRGAAPRRGKMDAQDRLWFAEYTGDRIGMFDTRTEQFKEWLMPHKYSTPYAASVPDKDGYVYATSNMSERLMRLDPKTGAVIEYLIPTDFDSKEIMIDPSTKRVTIWMSNTRNARMLRVEPLD